MNDSVWERWGTSTMSKNLYVLSICGFTAFGIFVSMLVAQTTLHMEMSIVFALVVLALGICGILLAYRSSQPIVSLLGYMMVAVPYGALLGPLLNLYITVSIVEAFFVTTIYVAIFGVIGAIIPDALGSWAKWIIGGLLVSILGYFIIPIGGFFGIQIEQALGIWDWATIALFAFIIMYDFNKALRIPYTLDNSIDVAIAIYLDWFNVFIRYLSRRGSRD